MKKPERLGSYSPQRRTAVVLCGTGAHGAYHAGVLRALHEAGVKVDVVAGHGVGAGSAALAAIDGASRLWDDDGLWRKGGRRGLYRSRPLMLALGWIAAVLVLVLMTPLFVLGAGLIVYPIGFVLQLLGLDAGGQVIGWFSNLLQTAFSSDHLPTEVPRLAMLVLAVLTLVAFIGVEVTRRTAPVQRRASGRWWWRLVGAPLDAAPARHAFAAAIWNLIRGAAPLQQPATPVLARRYAEVLTESLGQPGFRELILVANDLDARRDIVAALLREPYRRDFLAPRPGRERRAEVIDFTGPDRALAFDVIGAALTPPLVCEPALVTFPADSFWRGETHRFCDRPAASQRLLEEVAAAGVTQVIVVSAVGPAAAPHALTAPGLDVRSRLGDFVTSAECAALRDAIEMARLRFDAVHLICPAHNPIGPFDFAGAYDQTSDRHVAIGELIDRANEDAYRQFIEPVVGASGDQLAVAGAVSHSGPAASPKGRLLFDEIET